jgi:chorismate mutase/prephenate dehydratase
MSIIAHIGKPGSFSHAAARILYGFEHTYLGCKSFANVFQNVVEGHAEIGIIPIENSLAGSIYENYDLFNKYPVYICAEQYLKVEHFLLAKKGNGSREERLKETKIVYSHPKALEQCQSFFAEHPWMKPTVALDTATAAHQVASSDDMTVAAIGGIESAHLYRLSVLADHVEDDRYNYTRFVYITKTKQKNTEANKCSLQIEVKHEPGSLMSVLRVLSEYSLNMTKIESRPIHGKPFEYQFYLDFEFDPLKLEVAEKAIDDIMRKSNRVKVLGMFKAGVIAV